MAIVIRQESPLQDDVRALIAELNDILLQLSPPEHCHHLTVEQMATHDTTVWIARDGEEAIGNGALRRLGNGVGEVKRMYVRPAYQNAGIAGNILARIELKAREDGLSALMLETGHQHPAAWRLYERAGFTRRGAFGEYTDNEFSIFYEKPLTGDDASTALQALRKKTTAA